MVDLRSTTSGILYDQNGTQLATQYISMDLTIREFVSSNSPSSFTTFELEPQGIVTVISEERISMPLDKAGMVHVKTALSQTGILAINTGIIDPDFSGPIASVLLNFGKEKVSLKAGDQFARVVVHQLTQIPGYVYGSAPSGQSYTYEQYRQKLLTATRGKLGVDFFNFEERMEKKNEQLLEKYKNWLVYWLPIGTLLVTLFITLLPYLVDKVFYQDKPEVAQNSLSVNVSEMKSIENSLKGRIDSLTCRLWRLEHHTKQLEHKK